MKKPIIFSLIAFGIITLLTPLALFPNDSLYSIKNNAWMEKVDDNTLIRSMSIPGTHDSGATHSIADVSGKCQELSINSQLKIGVRFFDLRVQLYDDNLEIAHGPVRQKLNFDEVMSTLSKYIKENPSEFLLISLKEENSPYNSTKDFIEELMKVINEHNDIICFDNTLPSTLKEARGKIYILSRCNLGVGIEAYYGWRDSTSFELGELFVQDNYCISDINIKKEDILNAIDYQNENEDKLVLNFTSCYYDFGFPPTYAGTIAKEINTWLLNSLNDEELSLGIMIMDFVTTDLADKVIRRNTL